MYLDINIGKKLSLGSGFLFSIPFAGSGHYGSNEKRLHYKFDFYEHEHFDYNYSAGAKLGFGISGRILFSIAHADNKKQYIGLTYFHELNPRYPAGVKDKAFTLSFITRNIETKEVRTRWDNYLLKHQKNKTEQKLS